MAKRQAKVPLGQTTNRLDGKNLLKIEAGEPPQREYWFRDRPYLFFVVRNEGKSRRWVFRYTWLGKTKKIEIGTFPKVSLASARVLWTKYNGWLVVEGKDPAVMLEAEANEAKDKSATVEHYLGLLKAKRRGVAPRTKSQYGRHWETIRKTIGGRPVLEVTRPELLAKFDIERLHYATPEECKQLCVQLYGLFEMVKRDFNQPNNIASYLTFNFQPVGHIRDVKHAPPMDYRDYPAFIKACHDYRARGGAEKGTRPDISLLTEMLFLTGVRPRSHARRLGGKLI